MNGLKLTCLFLICSCQPLTPAEEVTILKAELVVAQAKCIIYNTNQKYPREESVTKKCNALLNGETIILSP